MGDHDLTGKNGGAMLGPYLLGPNDTPENGIYTGDARELAKVIPDESVDLVFCDPIYDRIDDYRWLAETASRVLKMDRACLAWYGGPRLKETIGAMDLALDWVWPLQYTVVAKGRKLIGYNLFVWTTPCLWYRKGAGYPERRIPDTFISHERPSNGHKWNKNISVVTYWMHAFVGQGTIVFDPFTGGGTVPAVCKMLGRRYLAFEIDPDVAQRARDRVRDTQPPLFVAGPEQAALWET